MTLIEGVVASVIVALVAVAAIRAVTIAAATRTTVDARARATLLAQTISDWAAALPYRDDTTPTAPLGLDAGEIPGDPSSWDDVDDFHAFKMSPITDAKGNVATSGAWSAAVSVAWVDWTNAGKESPTETGVKRITVEIVFNGKTVAREVRTRALAWDVALDAGGAP